MKIQTFYLIITVLSLFGLSSFAGQKGNKTATEAAEDLALKLKNEKNVEGLRIHKVKKSEPLKANKNDISDCKKARKDHGCDTMSTSMSTSKSHAKSESM